MQYTAILAWLKWIKRIFLNKIISYKTHWLPLTSVIANNQLQMLYATDELSGQQTVHWILAASKGWIKQTYRKIMHTQNTQNHITGNDLVQIE